MEALLNTIHGCTICKPHLALGPRPIVSAHPSPRNRFWMKKNPWFLERVVPELKSAFAKAIS